MDDNLTKKADKLANWIIKQMQSDSAVLLKSAKSGDFDLADYKIHIKDGVTGLVGYEFLFLNFHLADLYVYEMLHTERNGFQNYIVNKVLHDMEIEMDSKFIDIYNSRLQEYSKYKKLIPETNKDETPKNTLFWEFGKRISSLITSEPDHITIVMAVKSLGVHAWANLWSLQLLHSKK